VKVTGMAASHRRQVPRLAFGLATALTIFGAALFWLTDDPFSVEFVAGGVAIAAGVFALIGAATSTLFVSRRRGARILAWMITSLVVTMLIGVTAVALTFRQLFLPVPTTAQWNDDLRALAKIITTRHPQPFSRMPSRVLDAFIGGELAALPSQTTAQHVMAFTQAVALLHDGHSTLFPFQPASGFRFYPVQAAAFSDGIYVTDAAPRYQELIGKRLIAIGNTPIAVAYHRMSAFIGADNTYTVADRIPFYLFCPEALQALGLISDPERAEFVFLDDQGHRSNILLAPTSFAPFLYWYFKPLERWKFHPDQRSLPLYQRYAWKNYWFSFDARSGLLFFEFRQVRDQGSQSFEDFGNRLIDFAQLHPVRMFVIDLRQNSGGDNTLVTNFVDRLSHSEKLNRPGHLFVLIGRHTFSAAVNVVSMLENKTEAVFVGDSTGAGPNHFGDPKRYLLPHSRLLVFISSRREEFGDPADTRTSYLPDLPATFSHKDFFDGRDPGLAAALAYKEPAPPARHGDLTAYCGRYAYQSDRPLKVLESGGGLRMEIADFMRQQLKPSGSAADRFSTRSGGPELFFVRDPDKRVVAIDWIVTGSSRRLVRLAPGTLTLYEQLASGQISKSIAAYRFLRSRNPLDPALSEDRLAHWGYERMRAGQREQALAMFSIATEFHPKSSVAHERLGDAEARYGRTSDAVREYRLAVQLDPSNDDARRSLRQLGP